MPRPDGWSGNKFCVTHVMRLLLSGFLFVASFCFLSRAQAQEEHDRNVIVVTLDGFRWQELFCGVDRRITSRKKWIAHEDSVRRFMSPSRAESRSLLMPFIWEVIEKEGQLYGNRNFKNKVNCTNHHLISYPGYSEMFVGFRHPKVSSNRKENNPHATVFEAIQRSPAFANQVAAFATWDAFPYILREKTSRIHVNAGSEAARGDISRQEALLNRIQKEKGKRTDSLTFEYAMAYLKRERPRVLLIGFDETDQHAHGGRYDEYLKAANRADAMIAELWNWVQSQADYRDRTTLLITTDHGRGSEKNNWRKHRLLAAGSRHIWFAVVGPDTPPLGEMRMRQTTYQNQVAKTIAAFLGLSYKNKLPVGPVVRSMIGPALPSERASARTSSE